MTTISPTSTDFEQLRRELDGELVLPGDEGYDDARTIKLATVDLRPAAIARVKHDEDVARVVRFARETGTELAVRSGGHSGAGHGSTDGGIVLDLRAMTALEVDEDGATAWAETGLTAGEVSAALAERKLAIGFGDTGTVGIGGITLGGGVGYLVRKHGLTIDNVLAADVVTADGERLRVDAASHPDLFWALRGGGGNFGVVTRFRYRLHPLEQIVGGMLVLPATAETVAGFMRLSEEAPEELSTIANVMTCPPMPFVAEEHHGTIVIMGMLCWAGDPAEGQRVLAGFRDLAEPLADMVEVAPYPSLFPAEDEDGEYRPTAEVRTMFMDHVDDDLAGTMVHRLQTADASFVAVQLRALGGASARVPVEATAYAHRTSRIMVNVVAFYDGEADRGAKAAWVEGTSAALHQGDDGAYVNFVGDEGPERVRAAYPGATWDRLVEVKRRYDPTNLFHRNQNVAVEAPRP